MAAERGRGDLADEGGAARAGQDDPDVGATGDLVEEVGDCGIGALRDVAPDIGLLADLENRCAAVFLGGRGTDHRLSPVVLVLVARQARA